MFWKELNHYLKRKAMILVNFEENDVMLKHFSFDGDTNVLLNI